MDLQSMNPRDGNAIAAEETSPTYSTAASSTVPLGGDGSMVTMAQAELPPGMTNSDLDVTSGVEAEAPPTSLLAALPRESGISPQDIADEILAQDGEIIGREPSWEPEDSPVEAMHPHEEEESPAQDSTTPANPAKDAEQPPEQPSDYPQDAPRDEEASVVTSNSTGADRFDLRPDDEKEGVRRRSRSCVCCCLIVALLLLLGAGAVVALAMLTDWISLPYFSDDDGDEAKDADEPKVADIVEPTTSHPCTLAAVVSLDESPVVLSNVDIGFVGSSLGSDACHTQPLAGGQFFVIPQSLQEQSRMSLAMRPLDVTDFPRGAHVSVLSGSCSSSTLDGSCLVSKTISNLTASDSWKQCVGHFGVKGEDSAFRSPSLRWCCDGCDCRDLADRLPCFSSNLSATNHITWYAQEGNTHHAHVQAEGQGHGGPMNLTFEKALSSPWGDLAGSAANGTFGISVTSSGDGQLVAASEAFAGNENGADAGQIRFFRKAGGSYKEEPSPLLGAKDQRLFGYSIDMAANGTTLVVASSLGFGIYETTSSLVDTTVPLHWNLTFSASAVSQGEAGSVTVSADGETAAWNVVLRSQNQGYVRVYRKQEDGSWSESGNAIVNTTDTNSAVYDKAVALSRSGDRLVVSGLNATARLFERSENSGLERWDELASVGDATSVAISESGDCFVVARGGNANTRAKVYCYNATDGSLTQRGQTLEGSADSWKHAKTEHSSNFGHSLSLAGPPSAMILAVGAPWHDNPKADSGRVQIHQLDGLDGNWTMLGETFSSSEGDLFGWSVHVSDDASTVVSGAPFHEGSGLFNSGTVRISVLSW